MLAYHNKQEVKDLYIARVKAHAEADEIIKGTYWQNGKGCAVGCTVHSANHKAYETELGIPRALARIEDGIFEGLSNADAKEFPLQFLNAIRIGADLSGIVDKFMRWLLVDPEHGVLKYAKKEKSRKAIEQVADLYARRISGETITLEDWQKARDDAAAAYAAYAAAAYAYADADADAAAYAAAYAADDAAAAYADADADADADAAYAYADAAAYAAAYAAASYADARSKIRKVQAKKLIALLKAA